MQKRQNFKMILKLNIGAPSVKLVRPASNWCVQRQIGASSVKLVRPASNLANFFDAVELLLNPTCFSELCVKLVRQISNWCVKFQISASNFKLVHQISNWYVILRIGA